MKFIFISVGKQNDKDIENAVSEYTSRIERYIQTEWKILPTLDIEKESQKILSNIDDGDFVILLDEVGKQFTTEKLAEFVERQMTSGKKRIVLIIGGAYGVSEEVKKRADFTWSLSELTFPHQIVRLLLSEAIYRAISVIKNEKYHHR